MAVVAVTITKVKAPEWYDDAACGRDEHASNRYLFDARTLEDGYRAKNICHECPVRRECLRSALENVSIWSVWGGNSPYDLRRVLSVTSKGDYLEWKRPPRCPYCRARPRSLSVEVTSDHRDPLISCSKCDFSWRSKTTAKRLATYEKQASRSRQRRS